MENIIKWHQQKYPKMQDQDLYKLLYQSEFGTGHSIENSKIALTRLQNEINQLTASNTKDLYEYISNDIIRINLETYKYYNLDINNLFNAFVLLSYKTGDNDKFIYKLNEFNIPFVSKGPVHHSEIYNQVYNPHYRIVSTSFLTQELKKIQALNFISNIKGNKIIALEGKCGSGKTTLSNYLNEKLSVTIIPIDDFFLPLARKTKNRLSEIGGNVDYERVGELLLSIRNKQINKYNKFNCQTQSYEEVNIVNNAIIILEGVYSYHKYFRHLIDYMLYLEVDNSTQDERLRNRSNYERFIKEWIPLENTYYDSEAVAQHSDIII